MREALKAALDIVSAVPRAVEEEAQARLQELVADALLPQAAMAVGAPQA